MKLIQREYLRTVKFDPPRRLVKKSHFACMFTVLMVNMLSRLVKDIWKTIGNAFSKNRN